MRELREILAEWERRQGESLALATVVRTRGSVYRRPGARMLIAIDGGTVGSVSGGCLETEAAERGRELQDGEEPLVVTFDTTDPSDVLFGTGSGCRGIVDLLIQRLPAQADEDGAPLHVLRFARERMERRERGVVATIVGAAEGSVAKRGDSLFLTEGSGPKGGIADPVLRPAIEAAAHELLAGGVAQLLTLDHPTGPVEVFLDRIEPLPTLIVFGAGYDAIPLVRMAEELGYEVTLVDHRPTFATPERFPQAAKIELGRPGEVWERLRLDADTSVVILTHNYALDRELLERLLPLQLAYVGLLGPALRKEQILEELEGDGLGLSAEMRSRLHAPIGLDLGADTPETVALAILAEMQAERTGHAGGPLRERRGPIHSEE